MKALIPMKLVANSTREFERYIEQIRNEEDFDNCKKLANRLLGYIDGLVTVMNTMICDENSDFTGDFSALLTEWQSETYGVIACKAIDAKADSDYIAKMFRNRDDLHEEAEAMWNEE